MNQNGFPFDISDKLDLEELRDQFSRNHRVQIRDVLNPKTAESIRTVLAEKTKWGLAWRAAPEDPVNYRFEDIEAMSIQERNSLVERAQKAVALGEYGFLYNQYPMLQAYLEKWDPGHPLDRLLENLNDQPFLDLLRRVSGIHSIIRASAQATSYRPGDFLTEHDDSHSNEPRRVAYVLNLAADNWKSDWGGFLNFFDADGNVELGIKPFFNSLNLFRVPQLHSVSAVAPYAPNGRFSITGWAMDP